MNKRTRLKCLCKIKFIFENCGFIQSLVFMPNKLSKFEEKISVYESILSVEIKIINHYTF